MFWLEIDECSCECGLWWGRCIIWGWSVVVWLCFWCGRSRVGLYLVFVCGDILSWKWILLMGDWCWFSCWVSSLSFRVGCLVLVLGWWRVFRCRIFGLEVVFVGVCLSCVCFVGLGICWVVRWGICWNLRGWIIFIWFGIWWGEILVMFWLGIVLCCWWWSWCYMIVLCYGIFVGFVVCGYWRCVCCLLVVCRLRVFGIGRRDGWGMVFWFCLWLSCEFLVRLCCELWCYLYLMLLFIFGGLGVCNYN